MCGREKNADQVDETIYFNFSTPGPGETYARRALRSYSATYNIKSRKPSSESRSSFTG